jgi:hypothetical protein
LFSQVQVKRATTTERKSSQNVVSRRNEFTDEEIKSLATQLRDIFSIGEDQSVSENNVDQNEFFNGASMVENKRRSFSSDVENSENSLATKGMGEYSVYRRRDFVELLRGLETLLDANKED